ncbi:MAG: hypothetical protein E7325_02270 [Clostridiales bacterium]|nr:hypothetical protein [Clostridiales bacterium]
MEIPHSERLKRARDTIREELQVISERREALEGNRQYAVEWMKKEYSYLIIAVEGQIADLCRRIEEEEANERIRAAKERRIKEREEKRNGRYAGNHEKVGA